MLELRSVASINIVTTDFNPLNKMPNRQKAVGLIHVTMRQLKICIALKALYLSLQFFATD